MLGITKDFAERIDSCNWLKNCGSYDRIDFEFPVSFAKSRDEAMRSITTIHWENACIDARGDFDLYLFHNYRELHNNINKIGDKEYLELFADQVKDDIYYDFYDDLSNHVLDKKRKELMMDFLDRAYAYSK